MTDLLGNLPMPQTPDSEPRISDGAAAFAICDPSLKDQSASFYRWLEKEGFTRWDKVGFREQPVVWVNVNSKMYAYGMPGIPVTKSLGDCVMSIDDFMSIYSILKKCEGQTVCSLLLGSDDN